LVFAGVAGAEVKKGDVLLDFYAGWTQQNISGGGDVSLYFGAIRPGVALTDNIRVAGVAGVAHASVPGTNVTAWLLGVSGEYVFMPANQLNPYIGGMFAYANANISGGGGNGNGWILAPRIGALYTLNTTNNLFGEFQYQIWGGDAGDALDAGFMLLFGIEHKFKVGQ
jgi:hypothetical protein